ncbi:MAG TPA: hypothetical protein VN032_00555, partial [Thermoanaerobaculia bacterium]|nr:hypothetical protein [Thermoanaerobaculia bacterium]
EKDPALRPASVSQVAVALPGGDPLAAALAAGETPSPEMVAAAGAEEQISPRFARSLLVTVVVSLMALVVLIGKAHLLAAVDSQKAPEVLRARAREILASLGMPDRPADWAADIFENDPFVEWVAENDPSLDRWSRGIARDAIDYFYRQSPTILLPAFFVGNPFPGPRVTAMDPPPSIQSGDLTMRLDGEGRLTFLSVQPRELEQDHGRSPDPDWAALFRAAGLDLNRFTPVDPSWTPSVYADTRAAWQGPHPERPGVTMRVEAAAYRGRPVSFLWLGPWSPADRDIFDLRSAAGRAADLIWNLILLALFFGGLWLVRQNLRAGRGDRRGALRLAGAVVVCELGAWVFGAHHVSSSNEFIILSNGLANAVLFGVFLWIVYVALEPFARRHWPNMLISWTRALSGRCRDPLVGRDLLIGAAGAALLEVVSDLLVRWIPVWLGSPPPAPRSPFYAVSALAAVAGAFALPVASLVGTLGVVFFLAFARRWVRVEWIAAVIVTILFSLSSLGSSAAVMVDGTLRVGLLVFVAIRFGLLAALAMDILFKALHYFVMTADPSAWYFYGGPIAIAVVLGLAIWGYRMAVPVRAVARAAA